MQAGESLVSRLRNLAISIILAGGAIFVGQLPLPGSPTGAFAYGYCSSTKSQETDGWGAYQGGWGTSAWIVTRNASFCDQTYTTDPHPNDFITAWSLTIGAQGTNYAQAGYFKYRSSSGYSWYAENSDPNCPNGWCRTLYGSTSSGDNYQYYELYNTSTHAVEMYVGGILLQATNYDPQCTNSCSMYWDTPWTEQFSGETFNSENDLPGSIGYKATFSSLGYASSKWNGQGTPSFSGLGSTPSPNSTRSYYCHDVPDSSSFNIWTEGGSCS
jgi:hypothetical protein